MIKHREKKVREARLKKGLSDSDISTTLTDYDAEAKYYLESHEEDDFYEDEELYDDLDLDGIDVDLDLGAEAVAAAAAEAEAAKRAQASRRGWRGRQQRKPKHWS